MLTALHWGRRRRANEKARRGFIIDPRICSGDAALAKREQRGALTFGRRGELRGQTQKRKGLNPFRSLSHPPDNVGWQGARRAYSSNFWSPNLTQPMPRSASLMPRDSAAGRMTCISTISPNVAAGEKPAAVMAL